MRRERSGRSVTLDIADKEGIAQLGRALRAAGYDAEHMRPMLRASDDDNLTPRPTDIPVILRLLPKGEPLAGLMKLFLMSLAVPEAEAAEALAPLSLERAIRLGVVHRVAGSIESTVRILPAGGLIFASDRSPERDADLPADHVMGVSGSSILLANLTVRRPIKHALDIGSGCGLQAVFAAKLADHVVACDINPRALEFTAFNALLNDALNVECRAGSFFEPVADESFDLIVSNPPFVISPEHSITFRDSGMRGDDVSREVLRQASAHLVEGGLAFVLVNWGVKADQDWREPLRPWVSDLPCDIWFLHHSSEAALLYAAGWNSSLQLDADAYASAIDRWHAHLQSFGFDSIGYGAAILRRRSRTSNWLRFDDLRGQKATASGERVAQLIAAQDFIAGLKDDRALLAARLVITPEHHLDQVLRARDGQFVVEGASLRLESGLRFETSLDAFSAHLFSKLDGRTLAEAVHEAARLSGDGVNVSEFESKAVQFAKLMLALGFARLESL